MFIKEYTYLHRNDFKAIYVCELCKHEQEGWGYNDAFFHDTVVPNATCPKCGKNSKGETAEECKARMGREFTLDLR